MKLGIIGSPEAKTLVHAKELGLDFVEFDLNPSDFFGRPLDEITPKLGEIQAAMEETGVEIGAVGRWASHILDENGDEIELKDDEDDYIPGMRDEMSYKSDDDEITGSGFTIEDVPVEEDDSLSAFGDAGDDDYTDDSDKEEE